MTKVHNKSTEILELGVWKGEGNIAASTQSQRAALFHSEKLGLESALITLKFIKLLVMLHMVCQLPEFKSTLIGRPELSSICSDFNVSP